MAKFDGTFDIDYSDGDKETNVPKSRVRPRSTMPPRGKDPLKEGMRVRANYKGQGNFYRAHPANNGDGTFDIKYDDGDQECGVRDDPENSFGRRRKSRRVVEEAQVRRIRDLRQL